MQKKKKRSLCSLLAGLFASPQSALSYVSQLVTKRSNINQMQAVSLIWISWCGDED